MSDKANKHWVALEANPEVLTDFIHKLGIPSQFEFSGMEYQPTYVYSKECTHILPIPRGQLVQICVSLYISTALSLLRCVWI